MKKLVIRSLAVFPLAAVFALAYRDFGIVLGAALALGSLYMSRSSLSLIFKFSILPAPIAAVASFFFRLIVLAVVFSLLVASARVNIVAVLASFIILYTLLLFLEMKLSAFPLYRIRSKERS